MNLRTLYATLLAFVVSFLLSWLVYGILLMDFYVNNMEPYEGLMKEMPNLPLMIFGQLAWSFFFVLVLQRWVRETGFMKGFMVGVIISFFVILYYDMYFMAAMNLFNWTATIVDILAGTLMGGITAGVAGWVLGYKKAESQGQV